MLFLTILLLLNTMKLISLIEIINTPLSSVLGLINRSESENHSEIRCQEIAQK